MGRTKLQPVELVEDAPLTDGLSVNLNAMTEHRLEIMQQFGDGLPYERDRIVHETRFYMAQSAEAMLEAGKRLVILKENEPHGDFINILENDLGLEPRVARRMMQASVKFLGNGDQNSKRTALTVLGKTKLYELMVLDDEELDALADGGTVAGATLDDIDRMVFSCGEGAGAPVRAVLRRHLSVMGPSGNARAVNRALLRRLPARERLAVFVVVPVVGGCGGGCGGGVFAARLAAFCRGWQHPAGAARRAAFARTRLHRGQGSLGQRRQLLDVHIKLRKGNVDVLLAELPFYLDPDVRRGGNRHVVVAHPEAQAEVERAGSKVGKGHARRRVLEHVAVGVGHSQQNLHAGPGICRQSGASI